MAGDHVYIFVPDRYPRLLDRLFASRTEVDPEDADFFGAFAVDPAAPGGRTRSRLCAGLPKRARKLTIGALMVSRLGGHAEYADRVTLGPIELIVRDVDEKGRIVSVGVALEPAPRNRQFRHSSARQKYETASAIIYAAASSRAPVRQRNRWFRKTGSAAEQNRNGAARGAVFVRRSAD